jgi:NAD(P)-dependent dehydrogenase (short-subunit alcohol dehydrogenase family)
VAYCGTKGAIELITKALAIELGPEGIRVNCIAPGWVSTRMNDHLLADDGFKQEQIDDTPLGRIGEPGDIAPAIVYMASDASRFMTGASVHVDGGYPASPPLRSEA